MKVYLNEQAGLSRAMARVRHALLRGLPQDFEVVDERDEADFVVVHTIGYPETEDTVRQLAERGQRFGIVQYCFRTTQRPDVSSWLMLWQMADVVWSYYDLEQASRKDLDRSLENVEFYHAPLGVDAAFTRVPALYADRPVCAMTSGYVSGPCSEAIEEVYRAACKVQGDTVHIGPMPVGMARRPNGHWFLLFDAPDDVLAQAYARARWVSGLRHSEGFELPALEGLCCGARPVLFDRPEMRRWYGEHAAYVPECSGDELTGHLVQLFATDPAPVSIVEREQVLRKFSWEPIINGFWERVRHAT